MTALEERLRRVLRYYDPVQPPETAPAHLEPRLLTADEGKLPGGCWCCAAGIDPLKTD